MSIQESRLERLEEDNYFLSEKVRQLDEVLADQQKQITALEQKLKDTTSLMGKMRDALMAMGNRSDRTLEFEIPPHYGKW